MQGLPDSLAVNNVSWRKIYDSLEPDHAPLPEPWRSDLSSIQKIVMLRMLRPDKLIPALTSFVAESLGRRFVEPKPFAIEPSYNDSTCNTPLIFVLSPGRYALRTLLDGPVSLHSCMHATDMFRGHRLARATSLYAVKLSCHVPTASCQNGIFCGFVALLAPSM